MGIILKSYRGVIAIGAAALVLASGALFSAEPQNFDGNFQKIVAGIKSGDRTPIDFTRTIAPNVTHRFQYLPDKPWMINIVEMKFAAPPTPEAAFQVVAEAGQDQLYGGERTTAMAAREQREGRHVVCAINADFYAANHRPVGMFVDDGHVFKNPYRNRPVFAVGKSGKFYINEVTLSVVVTAGGQDFELGAINPTAAGDEGAVFTWKNNRPISYNGEFAWFRLKARSGNFLPNDTALFDHVGPLEVTENFRLNEGEFALAVAKDDTLAIALANLESGSTIKIYPKVPEIPEPFTMAVGGIPRLITDGKIDVGWEKASIAQSFSTTEHPRTAVGFSQDGRTLWFVTVDGRQSGLSRGISLDDLAGLMRELGCWHAMNLDGGGSTTMVVRDQIANSPSDLGGERVVSNSVMLVMDPQRATSTGVPKPVIYPQNVLLAANSTNQFRVEWVDDYLNAVKQPNVSVAFRVEGNIGAIDPNGLLKAGAGAAKGRVIAKSASGAEAATGVEVAEIDKIAFHPKQLVLRSGEERVFIFSILAKDGRAFYLDENALTLTYPEFVKPVSGRRAVAAVSPGGGEISLTVSGKKAMLPVAVDQFRQTVIQSFDQLPAPPQGKELLDGKLFAEEATKVEIVTDQKHEGAGALKWHYGMTEGGTSAIYLNMTTPIAGEPLRLGLWVWGDGHGTWLRGLLQDKDGERFLVDWSGSGGISWKDEWRFVEFDLEKLSPYFDNPRGTPDPPFTLAAIYLAQQKEADKPVSSAVMLDAVTAIYAPGE